MAVWPCVMTTCLHIDTMKLVWLGAGIMAWRHYMCARCCFIQEMLISPYALPCSLKKTFYVTAFWGKKALVKIKNSWMTMTIFPLRKAKNKIYFLHYTVTKLITDLNYNYLLQLHFCFMSLVAPVSECQWVKHLMKLVRKAFCGAHSRHKHPVLHLIFPLKHQNLCKKKQCFH